MPFEVPKKRRSVRGMPFKAVKDKTRQLLCTISFKKQDVPIYKHLMHVVEHKKMAASELVVDALRMYFGLTDLELIEETILQKYIKRQLIGPELFKSFDDVIEWELKNTSHAEIVVKWSVTIQQFAILLYFYGIAQREQLRNYTRE